MNEVDTFSNNNRINLVDIIHGHLKEHCSVEQATGFMTDPDIVSIGDATVYMQRAVIGRHFVRQLLRHRANHELDVCTATLAIILDGEVEDWVQVISVGLLPFINDNQIKL